MATRCNLVCSRCRKNPPRRGQAYCVPCHDAYMRKYRCTYVPRQEQIAKARARRLAHHAVRRGLIPRLPCHCGATAQMHHPDYSKPLEVVWLCRPHHLEHHEKVLTDPPLESTVPPKRPS